jgi:large subunit ribosomal protein L15
MKYNELEVISNKSARRVGRGIAAGQGKTAGRGTKGQKARTGSSRRPGFSGGQNPLMQALPKLPGFTSKRTKPTVIYSYQLNQLKNDHITAETLSEAGLIEHQFENVKVVFKREKINKKFTIELNGASKQVIDQITKAGGTFKSVDRLKRSTTKTETKDKKR